MYIFIATIFIAELIIALNLILLLVKADRKVRYYNNCVDAFNPLAETALQYARCRVSEFNKSFKCVLEFIKKKKEQVVFKTVFMISIYLILILFKLKMNKASKIYKLVAVIRDLAVELAV